MLLCLFFLDYKIIIFLSASLMSLRVNVHSKNSKKKHAINKVTCKITLFYYNFLFEYF
jgi:hypothetical protein